MCSPKWQWEMIASFFMVLLTGTLFNIQGVTMRKFFAGMLMAVSLANWGPGFPCMAKAIFNYLCYGLGLMVHQEVDDIYT